MNTHYIRNPFSLLITTIFSLLVSISVNANDAPIAIAIHGGAGTILKSNMTPELEIQYREKLTQALKAGYQALQQGQSSIQAVEQAIIVLENSPLFNAGRGAVYTHNKTNELDASIMDGKTLNAGAVAGVTTVKNPILLASEVMSNSKHVMLSGKGAEAFAKQQNLMLVAPDYFYTPRRWQQIEKILKEKTSAPKQSSKKYQSEAHDKYNHFTAQQSHQWPDDKKFGTVGAAALDKMGNLAAGTSTGGMTNKKFGRIGDSPIIGAGTYADNSVCAISSTGHGEYFIRAAVAHDICARAKYKKISLQAAADEVIQGKLVEMKGEGGIVGLDPQGKPVFSFNSKGMYRGYIDSNGKVYIGIFSQESN